MASLLYAPTVVDLSQLAPPDLLDGMTFEQIVAAMKAEFLVRWEQRRIGEPDLPEYDTLSIETEAFLTLFEVCAYRELLVRARVNDAARAILLAYTSGSNLDHLAALFGVERAPLVPAPRPYATNPEDWESDARLKMRVQLAPEAFSSAGSQGAYIFHALSIDPTVYDAWAWSPAPGKVEVVVAGADGAAVTDDVVARLIDLFATADKTPLTDVVAVRKAEIVGYTATIILQVPKGPDPGTIVSQANAAVLAYGADRYRIRQRVYRAGLVGASKVGGVENVIIEQPLGDVIANDRQIPRLTGLSFKTQVLL